MESTSFKKEYEKESLPDGSVKLTYKEKRAGAHRQSLMGAFMMFYLFIAFWVWMGITSVLYYLSKEEDLTSSAVMGFILMMICIVYVGRKLSIKKSSILIKQDGIIFDKQGLGPFSGIHQLAFRDINDWGIGTESVKGVTYQESSYVYAYAGGQEVRITRHMKKPLATALLGEISGFISSH